MKALYYDYLNSVEWKQKRRQRLKLDGYQCQICGSATNLQVHHITYEHLYEDEELDDLVTLCKDCHTAIHESDLQKKAHPLPQDSGLFFMALRLLRQYSEDRTRAWEKFNEACKEYEPPLPADECSKIWLQAVRIVDGWNPL